jgi:RNA polymerase sigma factor (sigma-70 family)
MGHGRRSPAHAGVRPEARETMLESLALRYSPSLTRFFSRRVNNKADVADLVQDVFLRLSRLHDLSAIQQPEHYLFKTAASALRDQLRRDEVRGRSLHDEFDELKHGGSDLSPDRVLEGKQAVECLREALRALPERTRDVFVLRVFEGLKMAEIARALGISQRAVEKHYAKAMGSVAASLSGFRRA